MAFQDEYGLLNQSDRLQRRLRIALDQEVVQSIKIIESTLRVDQTRHDFAFGRFDTLPLARSRR